MKIYPATSFLFAIAAFAILLSSCSSGRIQHEYVTRENWYHRRPGAGTGHYHRTRTLSKFTWVKNHDSSGKESEGAKRD